MGHDQLDSILGSFSIPGMDFSAITRQKIPVWRNDRNWFGVGVGQKVY
jgi:hypothetical protein